MLLWSWASQLLLQPPEDRQMLILITVSDGSHQHPSIISLQPRCLPRKQASDLAAHRVGCSLSLHVITEMCYLAATPLLVTHPYTR